MSIVNWRSVVVRCLPTSEELVAHLLTEYGADGVSVTTTPSESESETYCEVTAYYPERFKLVQLLSDISAIDNVGTITTGLIKETDWVDNWKQYYHPARITRFLTIVPSWQNDYVPTQPGELVIRLDPDTSFGTGTHPTTRLALLSLELIIRGEESVIDIGTGSGVLAIAAALLGAGQIIATDLDAAAVSIAQSNVALNPVNNIDLKISDGLTGFEKPADIIVANILAEVLVNLISDAASLLETEGHLVLSGIYHDKIELIRQKVMETGLNIQSVMSMGEWHCLIATR